MGGCFSVSLSFDELVNQSCQWLCLKGNYVHHLPENLESLEKNIGALKAKRDDVQRRVNGEEFNGHRIRLAQVQVWLTSIIKIETQYTNLLSISEVELQRLCLCRICSKNLISSYRYGKRVIAMLEDIKSLLSQGEFDAVTVEAPIAEVEELPIQPTIVGQETMLDKVWNRLMGDEIRTVGLYGMGGVGKTTLLTQINNKFSERGCVFDVVIWVVVSQNATVHKIQGGIGEKLGLKGKEWDEKNETQRARDIHKVLKGKKFVLLLDDIWEKVSLDVVGVPFPSRENGCKVAFTTRSRDVCGSMGVDDPIQIPCLTAEKAWELFSKKVGENTLESHPDIPQLARKVAEKCKGLPLALTVIGETMACRREVDEWHRAIKALTLSATKFKGMTDEILPILKYSYDNLKGEDEQPCFLYCSLFPEDYRIEKEELIEYWISEKIIDEEMDRESALNKGHEILGTLVRACLLLKSGESRVMMHDVVREMALWIASDLGKQKERCIVQAGVGSREIPKVNNWNNVTRMSLMDNEIEEILESPDCPQLTTLLLHDNLKLRTIAGEFFRCMPTLLVLDLSRNQSLKGLPEEISGLVSLRYLNLSLTEIERLPVGLQELKMLIHLDLLYTIKLESLQGISKLTSLRTLKLWGSKVWLDMSLMKELQLLKRLEFVSVNIPSSLVEELVLYDQRVGRCIQHITISDTLSEEEPVGVIILPVVDHLRHVFITKCGTLEIKAAPWNKSLSTPCFSNLSLVYTRECYGLRDLTWLLFAPNLTHLFVSDSKQIEEIISKEKVASVLKKEEEEEMCPFQKLEYIHLENLPKLESIYWNVLPFNRLNYINVHGCPKLRKLPLDSKSVLKVEEFKIRYDEEEWKEEIEWEDEATRLRFSHSFLEMAF